MLFADICTTALLFLILSSTAAREEVSQLAKNPKSINFIRKGRITLPLEEPNREYAFGRRPTCHFPFTHIAGDTQFIVHNDKYGKAMIENPSTDGTWVDRKCIRGKGKRLIGGEVISISVVRDERLMFKVQIHYRNNAVSSSLDVDTPKLQEPLNVREP